MVIKIINVDVKVVQDDGRRRLSRMLKFLCIFLGEEEKRREYRVRIYEVVGQEECDLIFWNLV